MALVIVKSKALSFSFRTKVIVTCESGFPLIRSTASLRFLPSIGSLLMWVMKSPAITPAFCAGVSSIGLITLITPFSIVTSIPIPPNSPLVSFCKLSKSLGGK